jgi:hypothetical protein
MLFSVFLIQFIYLNISIFLMIISLTCVWEGGVGGEAPAGYFTLNYYSHPKHSTKYPPMHIYMYVFNI